MRRVSIANAAEGMVLKAAVYDVKGMPVLEIGETLTEAKLPLLARTLSAEILVEDPRTEDIPVGTMFPADVEAKATLAKVATELRPLMRDYEREVETPQRAPRHPLSGQSLSGV